MSGWLRNNTATIVDLFAGTGGMGLASLLAPQLRGRARIVYAAEIDARYVATIRMNYQLFARRIGDRGQLPQAVEAVDATSRATLSRLASLRRYHGGVTLLLAGPPCQGFSKSNRISFKSENPGNRLAIKTIDAVVAAMPKVVVIENVPGIRHMRSQRRPSLTVTEHIECELRDLGYFVETKLLDAAEFGVPQHRVRSFIVAVHGSIADEVDIEHLFPEPKFGPGMREPYRSVRDAFSDLPEIENGCIVTAMRYPRAPKSNLQRELRRYSKALFDHVTTRHSEYVLKRYERVPAGGNWQSIRRSLSNYSEPNNTHMNIYHRLHPDRPAKTIGNFRKAMTIHPWEHRGLSLREAARLQSLPDWMRFFDDEAGLYRGVVSGLSFVQQQVGNAVCFALTRDIVSHIFANA